MNTEKFERKLTAILSADVKGYSRLMRADEDETVRTLTSYRRAIARLVVKYRGRVVDSPGDNLLAEFGSGLDAVNCAVEIQRELAERNEEMPPERQMEFRIGVNLGDVIQEGERIYGDGVNITARVEGLAEGGGISISGTVYDSIEGKLGLEFENLGEHEVKNIDKPIRVYRILSYPGAAAHRVVKAKKAAGKAWRNAIMAIAAVLVVGAAVGVWHFYFRPSPIEPASLEKMKYPLPDKPSIAVLPFENLSRDPDQEYFCDGMTDQIITALSKAPGMFVIARNSVFTYKGKPVKVQTVAEDLGVRYVLEGSFQKSGDKVRITAQLIDALSGNHLWAERYDRDLKDIFALQDDITMNILTALRVKLTEGERGHIYTRGTNNLEAYLKVMQGLEHVQHFSGPEENALGQKLYEEAIELDPNYANAYMLLAYTYKYEAGYGSTKKPLKKAIELAKKALSINEAMPWAHICLAEIYSLMGDFDKAIAEGEKAVALEPNGAGANAGFGVILFYVGMFNQAIERIEKAERLNPISPGWYFMIKGGAYLFTGKYEEAIESCKKGLKKIPNNMELLCYLAASCALLGRVEEASAVTEKILKLWPKFSLDQEAKRQEPVFKTKDHLEPWFDALRKAGLPENPPGTVSEKPSIAVLPFANISGDPKEDYLSDGITENIITALSKTPKMLVIARNSVFTYKGKPVMVQQVSEELGVRYVLEGSVQRSGDKLRITAQLIDAKTGNHLWAERYDRDLKDLFDLQDDITINVITALQIKLIRGEVASLLRKGTKNLEAYLTMMKGMHHLIRINKNDNEISRPLFEEAIALDHNYAHAYVSLAWTYYHEAKGGWTKTPAKSYEKAVELAKKAIFLDEQNARAYMVLACVYAKMGPFEKAMAAGKKGLSLNPASSMINAIYGHVLNNVGRFNKTILLLKKAIRIDPYHPNWYFWELGWAYLRTGQNGEATAVFNKWISREPSNAVAHVSLGCALNATGKPEEAVEMFEKALNLNPDSQVWFAFDLAIARVGSGDIEKARAGLREVLSSHPDNADAYRGLSAVLIFEGKYEEALSMAKKAISLRAAPVPPYYYWWLGVPYLMIGEYEEGIAAFKKTISPWPEYIAGHISLTASYSLAGRMEKARAQAAEVLKINPKITLEDIAKNGYYNFQKADKERFINALRKAGLK